MAIYDTMQYIKCDVSTICVGMAASMGAFLLSSGTKGKRIALPNAEIMIHQPLGGTQGQTHGHADSCGADAEDQAAPQRNSRAPTPASRIETICADTERDNFLTAEEAQAYGLIDKVIYKR